MGKQNSLANRRQKLEILLSSVLSNQHQYATETLTHTPCDLQALKLLMTAAFSLAELP